MKNHELIIMLFEIPPQLPLKLARAPTHYFISINELKFACLRPSEAKQTVILEFGSEKSLLQGQARRIGGLCSENLNTPMVFQEFL